MELNYKLLFHYLVHLMIQKLKCSLELVLIIKANGHSGVDHRASRAVEEVGQAER